MVPSSSVTTSIAKTMIKSSTCLSLNCGLVAIVRLYCFCDFHFGPNRFVSAVPTTSIYSTLIVM
jgi:hypothetical protein